MEDDVGLKAYDKKDDVGLKEKDRRTKTEKNWGINRSSIIRCDSFKFL